MAMKFFITAISVFLIISLPHYTYAVENGCLRPRARGEKGFDIEKWSEDVYWPAWEELSGRFKDEALTSAYTRYWVDTVIKPVCPNFNPKDTIPSDFKIIEDPSGLTLLGEEILEQVFIPNKFISITKSGKHIHGNIIEERKTTTPAGREVPVYFIYLEPNTEESLEEFGLGRSKANYVLIPQFPNELKEEYKTAHAKSLEFLRGVKEGQYNAKDAAKTKDNLRLWIYSHIYGWEANFDELYKLTKQADTVEGLCYSDISFFIEQLWRRRINDLLPGEWGRVAQEILQPSSILRQMLNDYSHESDEYNNLGKAIKEVGVKLNSLRYSPYPAYTFVEFLVGTILPLAENLNESGEYHIARNLLLFLLKSELTNIPSSQNPIVTEQDQEKADWIKYLIGAVQNIPDFNEKLRQAANAIYTKEFLTTEQRDRALKARIVIREPARPPATTLKETLSAI